MNTTATAPTAPTATNPLGRIVRLGVAATAVALALPIGSAAAGGAAGPAEHGVIERQCEAHEGSFFVNTFDGLNLICSAPLFQADARPARMSCERMGGTFRTIGSDEPQSWACHFTSAG